MGRKLGLVLLGIIAVVVVALIVAGLASPRAGEQVSLSTVVSLARQGELRKVTLHEPDGRLTLELRDGRMHQSHLEPNTTVLEYLQLAGVPPQRMPQIEVVTERSILEGFGGLTFVLPMLLMAGLFIAVMASMRHGQTGDNQLNSFAKSRARLIRADRPLTVFDDVAGVEEAKEELQEVVEFLKRPARFAALGARVPRGVLLVGPPGTGKTLLARAVAGEAGVPFFNISGSEFVEMYVGIGAARVRDLFDQAKKHTPAIIFVDEIDAVGRQRGTGLGGGHDEREQTLNQILVEMDGFDTNTNVIVIAATNRPDVLDPALLRPGRFDRQIMLDRPDVAGRRAVLAVHTQGKPLAPEVSLDVLARQTAGFSGADLANLVNEAAILAARVGKTTIAASDLEEAVDRVVAGPERKSRLLSPREKAITAYHEVGHALAAHLVGHSDPVHKVSIVARGRMGGYTRLLPQEDRYLWTRSQFEATIVWALGGYAAEELIFGEASTGASNDLERATSLARRMVCEYGMSQRLGPVGLMQRDENVFLGRELGEARTVSTATADEIDREVRELLRQAHQRARDLLAQHRDALVQISELLVERETLEGSELVALLNGVKAPTDGQAATSGNRPAAQPIAAMTLIVQCERSTRRDRVRPPG